MIGTQIAIPDCVLGVPGFIIGTLGGIPPLPPPLDIPLFADPWQLLIGERGGPGIVVWSQGE